MSFYSAAVAATLKGDTVLRNYGVEFLFASETIALWDGIGPLDASAFGAPLFAGIGALGRISSITIGVGPSTETTTFQLSAQDARVFAIAQSQTSEIKGRRVKIYQLFFDNSGAGQGALIACGLRRTLIMDKIATDVQMGEQGPVMTITLSAESILARKNRRGNTFLTDADQRARFPGDRTLERVALSSSRRTVIWN